MKRMLEDGNEMGEGIMFPGDLDKENIVKLTALLLDVFDFFHRENIEVQVRHCFDQKGLEWNIKTFYFEKGFCLDKTYTFIILPNWAIAPFYEHSYNHNMIPSCKKIINSENDDIELNTRIDSFLEELKLYYKKWNNVKAVSFFSGEAWKVIFAKNLKKEQSKHAERRTYQYFKFLRTSAVRQRVVQR